jgi:hypothetical protein
VIHESNYLLICQSDISICIKHRNQGKTTVVSKFGSFPDKLFHIFIVFKSLFIHDNVSYIFGYQDTGELKRMKSARQVIRKVLNLLYRTFYCTFTNTETILRFVFSGSVPFFPFHSVFSVSTVTDHYFPVSFPNIMPYYRIIMCRTYYQF